MMRMTFAIAVLVCLAVASVSSAAVNMEFRPAAGSYAVGDDVVLGLYAVSDAPGGQSIAAMDMVIVWDPTYLSGVSLGDPQDCWMIDGFFDGDLEGLNENLNDGAVYYSAMANLGEKLQIDSAGLLCVDLEFKALAPVSSTLVRIIASQGADSSRVLDGTVPNLDVKGTLGTANISIGAVPEASTLATLMTGICFVGGWRRSRVRR